jgi:hypothetical protein
MKAVGDSAGRNKRSVWTVATTPYKNAHFACVDASTECLTVEGWRTQDQIRPGMVAAQFDIESGRLSWAPIENVARYDVVDEPMIVAKSRDVEMVLTPNHRTIVSRRHGLTRQHQPLIVIRADELRPSHAVPVSADWMPEGDEPVSPDWAELLGWYLAEGCESAATWAVEIYQSRSANPAKVARIRLLLDAVGAEYTTAEAARKWRGEDRVLVAFQVRGFAAAFLRQWVPSKGFHPSVLTWSARLLSRLLDGLIDGDGHRRPDGRFCFVQRDKESAGIAQAIGVRLGYATMLSRRSEATYAVYFTRKRLISFRGTAGEGAQIETRPYTGIVWCPKLPVGTWVARKNGRAFITGNTFPPKLIEPCIKAGTSEKGCCPACGAGWVREVERPQPPSEMRGKARGKMAYHTRAVKGGGGAIAAWYAANPATTLGWRPSCSCPVAPPLPCLVLDPFGGAGTTPLVAVGLGRRAIACDINPEYLAMARRRIDRPHAPIERRGDEPLPLFGAHT